MFSPLVLLLASLAAFAGNLTVDVLDVGQGDAVLLRSPGGKTVLIDAEEDREDVVGRVLQEIRAVLGEGLA